MAYSILNSTFKIFAIKQAINVDDIDAHFNEEKTFTISEFIRFASEDEEILTFFDYISSKNEKLPNQ